jgi:biopolymer transport protein ExbB
MEHSLLEYIHLGGNIMYLLVALNTVGIALMLWKFVRLVIEKRQIHNRLNRMIGDLRRTYEGSSLHQLEDALYQSSSRHLLACESGLNTIKVIASTAPILGMLGTVVGVLQAFETIADAGLSQGANTFASGISLALVTTVGGLIVALPHYIGYNYLSGSLTKLEAAYEALIIEKLTNEKIG